MLYLYYTDTDIMRIFTDTDAQYQQDGTELGLNQAETVSRELTN